MGSVFGCHYKPPYSHSTCPGKLSHWTQASSQGLSGRQAHFHRCNNCLPPQEKYHIFLSMAQLMSVAQILFITSKTKARRVLIHLSNLWCPCQTHPRSPDMPSGRKDTGMSGRGGDMKAKRKRVTVSNSQTGQSFFLVRRAGLHFLPTFTCQPHTPVLTAYVATGTG